NAKAYSIPPTDAAGRYEIHNLPPGDWKVLVHQGKAQSEETIRLTSVGEHATLDLRLTEAGRK
ncbi:MAG: carboxypeptidase-like regulatory domain-containing protein, partial [Kiritimatiellaeota bacterium]|nr:carboxypeptidase-like regulatory domain-containing protein [Kiritimatiellota bacterium]